MPIANSLPELNYKAGDYSDQLNKMAEFKRQQQQDAAVQETRDLTNQGLRKELDPTNPMNLYKENKARSDLGKIMKDDWKTYSMEATTLPDAELPDAYDKLVERFKPYAGGAVIDSSAFKNADGTTDTKKLREHIKTSIQNIDNVGKDGTEATAIVENPAWKSDADTEKGIPHYLKKSGVNRYDGTVKWDENKTEPYLSKWEQTMMTEGGKKDVRDATAAYRGATLAQGDERNRIAWYNAMKEKKSGSGDETAKVGTINQVSKQLASVYLPLAKNNMPKTGLSTEAQAQWDALTNTDPITGGVNEARLRDKLLPHQQKAYDWINIRAQRYAATMPPADAVNKAMNDYSASFPDKKPAAAAKAPGASTKTRKPLGSFKGK